jgi:Ca-activated chloride channel family protein
MRVYVLGVGSTQGAPIPIAGTGEYMKDNTGNTVMSALNEDMCKQVAQAGGGAYIHVQNNSAAQEQLDQELDKLAKKETSTAVYSEFDEQFRAFGILALLLLILEICIFDRRNPLLKRISLFGNKKQTAAMLLLLVATTASAQSDRQYIREGNKLFHRGDYPNAEVAYRKAIEKNPKNPQAPFNLGNALMAQKKDSAAVEQFEAASRLETNPLRKSKSFHNIGVICQTHKMYGEAIEAYKNALRLNPFDDETRYNLVLCKHQKNKQDQQQQNQQGQNNDDKKDNKKDDKKDQQNQDQNKDQKQDQQKEQPKPQMSKENAEQLLNAAIQNEKQTQEKMKKAQQQPQRRNIQKNW